MAACGRPPSRSSSSPSSASAGRSRRCGWLRVGRAVRRAHDHAAVCDDVAARDRARHGCRAHGRRRHRARHAARRARAARDGSRGDQRPAGAQGRGPALHHVAADHRVRRRDRPADRGTAEVSAEVAAFTLEQRPAADVRRPWSTVVAAGAYAAAITAAEVLAAFVGAVPAAALDTQYVLHAEDPTPDAVAARARIFAALTLVPLLRLSTLAMAPGDPLLF